VTGETQEFKEWQYQPRTPVQDFSLTAQFNRKALTGNEFHPRKFHILKILPGTKPERFNSSHGWTPINTRFAMIFHSSVLIGTRTIW
jgi:hypothetical protein